MGRNSRAKKERRAAKRAAKAVPAKIDVAGGGPRVVTPSFLGDDGGHGVDDGCPICVAMREMGLGDISEPTPAQMERLLAAFEEAEAVGGVRFGPFPGAN